MKITMAHGSGGKNSAQLMEEVFHPHFHNDILDRMEDAAVLDLQGRIACSTDSFVVKPLRFPGGDIGKLSICGTANDLLMMGARPQYLTCGFILEEGLDMDLLGEIVASMAREARNVGVQIVAGDTKVIEGQGGLLINTSGLGMVDQRTDISAAHGVPGDQILVSGPLGNHHSCILSQRMAIENEIVSDCAYLGPIVEALLEADIRIKTMRDVTRGGLGTVLNEIATASRVGMVIEEERIPVDQAVKGFSDVLGLDPLYMGNEGKLVAVVDAADASKALDVMKKSPLGEKAAIVGEVVEGQEVFLQTPLGGKRVLDVLYGEGLPRIC